MTDEQALLVALRALEWLAGQPDEMNAFMTHCGISVSDIPRQANDPAFLAAVLSFIATRDWQMIEAAAAQAVAPEELARANATLNSEPPHWT